MKQPQTEGKPEALRRTVTRSQPHGNEDWLKQTAKQLGLESTLRSRGRPRKTSP